MGEEEEEQRHFIPALSIQSKFPMYSKFRIKLSLFQIEFGSFVVLGLLGVFIELSRTWANVSWIVELVEYGGGFGEVCLCI